jgi:hypothetical protein
VVSGEFMESSRRDVIEAVLDQDDIQAVNNVIFLNFVASFIFKIIFYFFLQEEFEKKKRLE